MSGSLPAIPLLSSDSSSSPLIVIDWQTHRLPDAFTLPGIAAGLFLVCTQTLFLAPRPGPDHLRLQTPPPLLPRLLRRARQRLPHRHRGPHLRPSRSPSCAAALILLLIRWTYQALRKQRRPRPRRRQTPGHDRRLPRLLAGRPHPLPGHASGHPIRRPSCSSAAAPTPSPGSRSALSSASPASFPPSSAPGIIAWYTSFLH